VDNDQVLSINITGAAAAQLKKFMEDANLSLDDCGIRIQVLPGGCSGFRYGLDLAQEPETDDIIIKVNEIKIFTDVFSAQYLNGTTIDWVESVMGSGFTFENPNATGGCGCGSSFSA